MTTTQTGSSNIQARMFARDLAACIAAADARKAENAKARAASMANEELSSLLRDSAERRGEVFSWADYFRNAGIND